jgi:hypothetical protein
MSNAISKSDDVCVVNSNTIGAVSGTGSAHPNNSLITFSNLKGVYQFS